MKTFQDYVSFKEVSGTNLSRGITGLDQNSPVSLSPKEIQNISELLKLVIQSIDENSPQMVVDRLMSLVDSQPKDGAFKFSTSLLKSAAEKILPSFHGEAQGLGDKSGSDQQIAPSSADQVGSIY